MSAPRDHGVDVRFVHALLERELGAARGEDQRRLEVALAALAAEDAPAFAPRPTRRRSLWVAAAAALLVGTFVVFGPGGSPTEAALATALRVAGEDVDRTYELTIEPALPRLPDRRVRLTVRGAERFVLEHLEGPLAGLTTGFDGRDAWLVPALERAPVFVSAGADRVHAWLDERDGGVPFLHLTELLGGLHADELVREDVGDAVVLRSAEDRPLRAARVRVVLDRATGLLRSAVIEGGRTPGGRLVPGRVSVTLLDESPRAPGFYEHGSHHAATRVVRRR